MTCVVCVAVWCVSDKPLPVVVHLVLQCPESSD